MTQKFMLRLSLATLTTSHGVKKLVVFTSIACTQYSLIPAEQMRDIDVLQEVC